MNCKSCGMEKDESELVSGLCFFDDCLEEEKEEMAVMRVVEILSKFESESFRARVAARALGRLIQDSQN